MALRYTNKITINKPKARVAELMENPDNMKHWQPGFMSMEFIEGEPGKEGSKSILRYEMGSRVVEMTETIVKNALPDEFNATYEAKGVYNEQVNLFHAIDENTTEWESRTLFEFQGFMKLMGWLMPGSFKKQSCKYLELFKEFAEKQD